MSAETGRAERAGGAPAAGTQTAGAGAAGTPAAVWEPLSTPRREVYRYLGYRGIVPDETVRTAAEECIAQLAREVTPRQVRRLLPLTRTVREDGAERLVIEGIPVDSLALQKNLRGCEEICLMACTLGPGPDRLIRRASVAQMSRAVILQAASAAMIEDLCDLVNARIREEAAERGLRTRPRFSPGYGDLPLELQRGISRILQMPKTIGVGLTDTLLMTPSKSVTAIVGLVRPGAAGTADGAGGADADPTCTMAGCALCGARETCAYRKEDS